MKVILIKMKKSHFGTLGLAGYNFKALSCTPTYLNWVRKNSESEWELPKQNGLVAKRNDICGNITSWLV